MGVDLSHAQNQERHALEQNKNLRDELEEAVNQFGYDQKMFEESKFKMIEEMEQKVRQVQQMQELLELREKEKEMMS